MVSPLVSFVFGSSVLMIGVILPITRRFFDLEYEITYSTGEILNITVFCCFVEQVVHRLVLLATGTKLYFFFFGHFNRSCASLCMVCMYTSRIIVCRAICDSVTSMCPGHDISTAGPLL